MIELKITAFGRDALTNELERISKLIDEGYVEGETMGGGHWQLNEDYE